MVSTKHAGLTPLRHGPVSPALGRLWIGGGWLLRIAAVVVAIAGVVSDAGDVTLLAAAILLGVAYPMVRRGKRLAAARAEALLVEDRRPPIVYLRSFLDEDQDKGLSGVLRSVHLPDDRQVAYSTPAWGSREQDALAAVFKDVGPYVAIGKPGEALPELGAARMYVGDDAWQAEVQKLIRDARLVVVRAGATEGLRWEVAELVRSFAPTKLLIILPARVEHYSPFRSWADQVLPLPLPVEAPKSRLMTFGSDWQPIILPRRRTVSRSLEPFFEQNGIRVRETLIGALAEHNGLRL